MTVLIWWPDQTGHSRFTEENVKVILTEVAEKAGFTVLSNMAMFS